VPFADHAARQGELDRASGALDLGLMPLDHLAHELAEVDLLAVEPQVARLDPGRFEQLVDEPREALHLALGDRDLRAQPLDLDRRAPELALQALYLELQRGERRAELVRHDREELFTEPRGLLLDLGARTGELGEGARDLLVLDERSRRLLRLCPLRLVV